MARWQPLASGVFDLLASQGGAGPCGADDMQADSGRSHEGR